MKKTTSFILDRRALVIGPKKYDDFRELFQAMGNWAYTTDFTYRDSVLENPGQMMANFVASHWLDVPGLALDGAWKELDSDECDEIARTCLKLGVFGALPAGLVTKAVKAK